MKILLSLIMISSLFGYQVKIPEASGICEKDGKFYVANDEGRIYIVDGNKIIKYPFKGYDFEGIYCGKNNLFLAVENKSEILKISYKMKIKDKIKLKIKNYSKAHGIEGIAKKGDKFYIVIQNKKEIYVFKKSKLVKKLNIGIKDMSGIDIDGDILYVVSDKNDKLYFYDIKKEKIIKTKKLPKIATEGIVKTKDGFYLANDDGDIRKLK